MKSGPFEVTLFNRRDNSTFQERRVHGIDYFVAVPGEEYKVQVKLDDTYEYPQQDKSLNVTMKLDGQCVGAAYSFYSKRTVVFEGFYLSNIQAFKFDLTKENNFPHQDSTDDIGYISLKLNLVVETAYDGQRSAIPNFKQNGVSCTDKKFWQTASSCTTVGSNIREFVGFTHNIQYIDVLATASFPYHTAANLDLMEHSVRRVLPVTNIKKEEDNDEDIVEVVEKEGRKITVIDLTAESELRRSKRMKTNSKVIA